MDIMRTTVAAEELRHAKIRRPPFENLDLKHCVKVIRFGYSE